MVVVTFDKTRDAIQAEKLCRQLDIEYRMIPVPRSISAQCGMAVQIDLINKDALLSLLNEKGIASRNYNKADVRL